MVIARRVAPVGGDRNTFLPANDSILRFPAAMSSHTPWRAILNFARDRFHNNPQARQHKQHFRFADRCRIWQIAGEQ